MEEQTVHLFVFDTMADWEAGHAVAGINQPEYQANPGRYRVRTVGPTRDAVRTLGGVTILPDLPLAELEPGGSAMLILPGGTAWEEGEHGAVVDRVPAFLEAGVPVAAICAATGALAARGLLDARPHTSNAPEYLAMVPGYGGQAHYVRELAVGDGDLITASGAAPVEFARRIFERLELYAPEMLAAWHALHTTGDASAFFAPQPDAEAG